MIEPDLRARNSFAEQSEGQPVRVLGTLLDVTSNLRGEHFLRQLVRTIGKELGVAYVYVAECVEHPPSSVRTVALWTSSGYGANFDYLLHHTPCERVFQGHVCQYSDDLCELFPQDALIKALDARSYIGVPMFRDDGKVFGHLVIMDTGPLAPGEDVMTFLRTCAFMAQIEIERYRSEVAVREQRLELDRMTGFVARFNAQIGLLDLLQTILDETLRLTGASKATAVLLDSTMHCYRLMAGTGDTMGEKHITLSQDDLVARCFTDTLEVSPDLFLVEPVRGRPAEEKLRGLPMPVRMMAMRITVNDTIVGALIFDCMDPAFHFSDQTIQTLSGLKAPVTAAVIKARMLDELSRLNKQKNEFLGMVAHDLRNPLQAISGYVGMMMESLATEQVDLQQLGNDLSAVHHSVLRMSDITCRLLNLASIESGKIPMRFESHNYPDLVATALEEHRATAARKNIRLAISNFEDVPPFAIDACAIHEVLDNLISNAIKYTHPGGRVTISGRRLRNEFLTTVADTGVGLPPEDLQQLFVSFRKLSARPTGGETSTGLGLAIVKKIVENHGGRLEVRSVKGEGSSFTFSLPTEASNRSLSGPTTL